MLYSLAFLTCVFIPPLVRRLDVWCCAVYREDWTYKEAVQLRKIIEEPPLKNTDIIPEMLCHKPTNRVQSGQRSRLEDKMFDGLEVFIEEESCWKYFFMLYLRTWHSCWQILGVALVKGHVWLWKYDQIITCPIRKTVTTFDGWRRSAYYHSDLWCYSCISNVYINLITWEKDETNETYLQRGLLVRWDVCIFTETMSILVTARWDILGLPIFQD